MKPASAADPAVPRRPEHVVSGRLRALGSAHRPWALRPVVARWGRAALRGSPVGRRIIWSLPTATNAVVLTFDDGPDPDWTPQVLQVLADHGATATFFLIGGKASEHPELVRRIQAEGHSLGSHTFSHVNLRTVGPGFGWREMRRADAVLRDITGRAPRWFRPPFGAFSATSLLYAGRAGERTVLWNVDPRDYAAEDAGTILAGMGPLEAGDVVLLHDRSAALLAALPEVLARVGDAGLEALSLDGAVARLRR